VAARAPPTGAAAAAEGRNLLAGRPLGPRLGRPPEGATVAGRLINDQLARLELATYC